MSLFYTTDEAFDTAVTSTHKELPLILCEGDSWFAYPDPTIGNIPFRINRMGDYNILNLASSGDEALRMLSGRQKKRLAYCLDGYDFNMLFFSGGGNDIVGEHLPDLLVEKTGKRSWERCINKKALKERIGKIRGAYDELVGLRDKHCPGCPIVTHDYDYPIPGDAGVCGLGPWLKPAMVDKGITDADDQRRIATYLIVSLTDMQRSLAAHSNGSVVFVKTSGTLNDDEWANEIHPNVAGFRKIASKFWPLLEERFPDYTS